MPGPFIIPARMSFGDSPPVISQRYATGQTFGKGAVLALTAGEAVVATSPITGATILGVSLEPVASKPGYDAANSPATITGRVQEVSIVRGNPVTLFSSELVNGSAVRIAPVQADVGVAYGLNVFAGVWVMDKSQLTTNSAAKVVDIDIDKGLVFWTFLTARLIP